MLNMLLDYLETSSPHLLTGTNDVVKNEWNKRVKKNPSAQILADSYWLVVCMSLLISKLCSTVCTTLKTSQWHRYLCLSVCCYCICTFNRFWHPHYYQFSISHLSYFSGCLFTLPFLLNWPSLIFCKSRKQIIYLLYLLGLPMKETVSTYTWKGCLSAFVDFSGCWGQSILATNNHFS